MVPKGRAATVKQKREVLEDLRRAWDVKLGLRLGQLIVAAMETTGGANAINLSRELFYIEDDELIGLISEFVAGISK